MLFLLFACEEPKEAPAGDTWEWPAPDEDDTGRDTGGCRYTMWIPDADADEYGAFEWLQYRCFGEPGPEGYIQAPGCLYDDNIDVYVECHAEYHDCDDTDPAVHPGAEEVWYDGIDANCDGAFEGDADGDGHAATSVGGPDCDDTDDTRAPDAPERCDGEDDDCDGVVDGPPCGTVAGRDDVDQVVASGVGALEAWDLENLGDVDGDGADDLLVTTFSTTEYVLADVRAAASVGADAVATIRREEFAAVFSGPAGDVDGDGLGDLWLVDRDLETAAFVPGPLTGTIRLDDATWTQDHSLGLSRADVDGDDVPDVIAGECLALAPIPRGARVADRCAAEVPDGATNAGDLDGDGLDDLVRTDFLAGDPGYVFHAPFAGTVRTADADGRFDWESGGGMGVAAPAGDVDGDGLADLAAGDYTWHDLAEARRGLGSAYVIVGPAAGRLDLADAWARIRGEPTSSTFGWTLHGPGDLDGDGRAELLVSGDDREVDDTEGPGAAWLLGPISPGTWVAGSLGTKWQGGLSYGVAPFDDGVTSGDLDGDGVIELVFGLGGEGRAGDALWIIVP